MDYHKIQSLFKRTPKGKIIHGDWAVPEIGYLANCEWEFTEQIEGTNVVIHHEFDHVEQHCHTTIQGRTSAAQLHPELTKAINERLESGLSKAIGGTNGAVTFYGEGVGEKVNGSGKYLNRYDIVIFDIKIGDYWLDYDNVDDICNKLGWIHTPRLGAGTIQDAIDIVSSGLTWDSNGKMTRWGSGGLQSKFGSFEAEGIVARPAVQMFDRQGNRIIAKIKARDFR